MSVGSICLVSSASRLLFRQHSTTLCLLLRQQTWEISEKLDEAVAVSQSVSFIFHNQFFSFAYVQIPRWSQSHSTAWLWKGYWGIQMSKNMWWTDGSGVGEVARWVRQQSTSDFLSTPLLHVLTARQKRERDVPTRRTHTVTWFSSDNTSSPGFPFEPLADAEGKDVDQ